MASTSVISYGRTTITERAASLTYTADQYRFQFQLWRCVGTTTTRYSPTEYRAPIVYGTSSSNYYMDYSFSELLPNNKYEVKILAEYPKDSGTWYDLGTVYQTLTNISKPGGELIPGYYPEILDQDVMYYASSTWYNLGGAGTCTACSIATCLDIMKKIERGTYPNEVSIGWIYGNRKVGDHSGAGLVISEALANIKADGVPVVDRVPRPGYPATFFPDNYFLDSTEHGGAKTPPLLYAEDVIDDYWDLLEHEAKCQKIDYTSTIIDFYDCAAIAAAVTANGCCLVQLFVSTSWDNTPSTGIVAEPVTTAYRSVHCVTIIGWGTVSSEDVWICQNSWGEDYGDDGIYYVRMDYGLAVASPSSSIYNRWIYDAYEIKNVATHAPDSVVVTLLTRYQDATASLALYWDKEDYCDYYKLRYKISGGSYSYVDDIGIDYDADYASDDTKSEYDLESLAYGTTYLISVAGRNSYAEEDQTGAYTADAEATTAPKRPTQSKVSMTTTSIAMSVAVSSGNWTFCRVYYKLSTDGSYTNYITIAYPATTGTIPSLTAGLTYNIKTASYYTKSAVNIQCRDSVGAVAYSSVMNQVMKVRPSNWAWTSTVVQGGAITLVNATKKITILTAAEWNAFTVRINDFREYKGVADYSFTTVVAGNAALYSQANEARSAISTLSPPTTLPAAVSQYGKVTAAFINGLKNSLNSIA